MTPRWTWTDEARADALRAVVTESDAPGDHALTRVLNALAPHVARQVVDLTADVERLRTITEAARDTRFPDGEVYVSFEMYDHALTQCVEAEIERDEALQTSLDNVRSHWDERCNAWAAERAELRAEVAATEQRGADKVLRDVIERLRGFGVEPAVVEHFTVLVAARAAAVAGPEITP